MLGNTVMVSGADEEASPIKIPYNTVAESAVCDSTPSQQTPSRLSCVRQLYEGSSLLEKSVLTIMKSWRKSTFRMAFFL